MERHPFSEIEESVSHGDGAETNAVQTAFGSENIVGESPLLRDAIKLASQVAAARRTTVLLIGETGTGK